MNLKQRFSIFFSLIFSLLLGVVMFVVYTLYSEFRKEEFKDRLSEKAATTIKLLLDVKEVDYQLLKIIDKNTINKLYNEKTLVFNDSERVIYSSIDDATINWSRNDLNYLKTHKELYRSSNEYEIYGLYFESAQKDYYVLLMAEDKYGNRKLEFLKYLLISAFVIGTILVFVSSFLLSKRSLQPLDVVQKRILEITDKNLNVRLHDDGTRNEINILAQSFNTMMDRIDKAYTRQKEFTGNASHELRTPIARMATQLENLLHSKELNESSRKVLSSISEDIYQLSDVVTSLLLLSKIDNTTELVALPYLRLDEILFQCVEDMKRSFPDLKFNFNIAGDTPEEIHLEVKADETLLKIALHNLIKNAYLYSDDKTVSAGLHQTPDSIVLSIRNNGPVPDVEEKQKLFEAFTRGSNTKMVSGSGLGLRIVQRILQYFKAMVSFETPTPSTNEVIVIFPYLSRN